MRTRGDHELFDFDELVGSMRHQDISRSIYDRRNALSIEERGVAHGTEAPYLCLPAIAI